MSFARYPLLSVSDDGQLGNTFLDMPKIAKAIFMKRSIPFFAEPRVHSKWPPSQFKYLRNYKHAILH